MTQEFEVSAEELLRTLKRRGIPLPSEIGAFITLEACEQVLDRPAELSTQDVAIGEIGEVLCADKLPPCSEADAVKALLLLLGDLLVCAAPGVPSMLLDLVEHGASRRELSLAQLLGDLEACLMPLNRGATRRVLARLVRETRKTGPSLRPSSKPAPAELDAQFDALLGGAGKSAAPERTFAKRQPGRSSHISRGLGFANEDAPTRPMPPQAALAGAAASAFAVPGSTSSPPRAREPEPDPQTPPRSPWPEEVAVAQSGVGANPAVAAAILRARSAEAEPPSAAAREREPAPRRAPERAERSDDERSNREREAAVAVEPAEERAASGPRRRGSKSAAPSLVDLDEVAEARAARGRLGLWVFGLSTAAALGLLLIYFTLGRESARQALGLLSHDAPPPVAAKPAAPARPAVGDLLITSQPGRAQVLLFIGPGPTLATDIPLGVAQEFVALADGYAAARAVLPADAVWEELNGQPRYELAIQCDRARNDATALQLGATLLPRDVGTPQARLGSVRVVTTPRAAKVYQLIGFTPDVRVENLPLDQSYEILVYLEGRAPVQRHIEAGDFRENAGRRLAELNVMLDAKAR